MEDCVLPKHFASVTLKSPCSLKFKNISEVSNNDLKRILSDIGVFLDNSFTSGQGQEDHDRCKINITIPNAVICENHFRELKTRSYNRERSTKCSLPEGLKTHPDVTKKCDRRLTDLQCRQIFSKTGVVVPIGTGKSSVM